MTINPKKCVACGNCTYVCPMGAIYIDPVIKRATINRTECVECYACYNGLSQEQLNPTIVLTIQKMCWALAKADVKFEKKNPITSLMSDVATGTIREDVMDEKLMSAIIEIKVPVARTEEIVRLVWEVEKQVDTVVALGVGTRCDENGEDPIVGPILEKLGYRLERAKTNIGLGKITNQNVDQFYAEAVRK